MANEDLEGKYFVFDFYADYTAGTNALALLQFNKGSLEEILHPCDFNGWIEEIGEYESNKIIDYLLEKRITEVYSLPSDLFDLPKKLFGYPLHNFDDDNNWYHYDGIYDEWCSEFEAEGIELKKYDWEVKEDMIWGPDGR